MKILHLMLACFYIDNFSYQENLLPKYHKLLGHDVEIIASLVSFDENGKMITLPKASKYSNEYGIPVTRLEYKKVPYAHRLRLYNGLKRELYRLEPDVLFIHGVQFLDVSVVVSYLKNHPNIVVYVDNHSDYSNSATNLLSRYILHRIIWKYYAKKIEPYVRKFYGVLPARVDFLKTEYGIKSDKVELLVMGADDDRVLEASSPTVRANIRKKLGLKEDDIVLITGGKIDDFKKQTLLLMEAIKKIDNSRLRLIVFGSIAKNLKDKVYELVDGDKVKYIGWLSADDTYDYFSAADLAVFPGRHSVFWEQVVAQGIPMLCKKWKGTTHVNINGNVDYILNDTVEDIKKLIEKNIDPVRYTEIKQKAMKAGKSFLYSEIAERSLL